MTPRSAVRTVDHRDPDEVARMEAPRRGLKRWAALGKARALARDADDFLAGTDAFDVRDLLGEVVARLSTRMAVIEAETARIAKQEWKHA